MKKWFFVVLVIPVILVCCRETAPGHGGKQIVNRSFYFWKGEFAPDTADAKLSHELGVNKFYVRAFDVDWNAIRGPVPVGDARWWFSDPYDKPGLWDHIHLVPVVFITNRTIAQCSPEQADTLADRIFEKVNRKLQRQNRAAQELQIDCDWSVTTKDKYFRLLRRLKKRMGAELSLSVTLRLWQLRYPEKAGIPPADRVMLMCYNNGDPRAFETKNSILNLEDAESYIDNAAPYPLKMDLALPLFSWSCLFRNDKFIGLLNEVNEDSLKKNPVFRNTGSHTYLCTADTLCNDFFLREGDQVRAERAEIGDVMALAEACRPILHSDTVNIAFYHWDSKLIDACGHEKIVSIYAGFH